MNQVLAVGQIFGFNYSNWHVVDGLHLDGLYKASFRWITYSVDKLG